MKVIGNSSRQETNKVHHERTLTMQKPKKTAQRRQPPGQQHWRECDNCGYQDLENSESGPIMDKECLKCRKRNHFIVKCKSKGVKAAGLDDGESSEMYQKDVAAVKQLVTPIYNNESGWLVDSWQQNHSTWQHTPRCIAVALRPRLIEAIDDLAAQGVIALVATPTKWISSIVAASKKNVLNPRIWIARYKERIISFRQLKILRQPPWNQGLHNNGCKKWVLAQNLHEESSYLTTFQIPFGCYCWRSMPFGIWSAPKVFQQKIYELNDG